MNMLHEITPPSTIIMCFVFKVMHILDEIAPSPTPRPTTTTTTKKPNNAMATVTDTSTKILIAFTAIISILFQGTYYM